MIEFLKKLFGKKEKVEPPEIFAKVKLNSVAKENAIYDEENKIIEISRYGKITKVKYSEAEVESLREQGIPVIDEEYSDEYEFLSGADFGGLEYRR
jgi:hypothetical protein